MRRLLRLGFFMLSAALLMAQASPEEGEDEEESYQESEESEEEETEEETEEEAEPSRPSTKAPPPAPSKAPPGSKPPAAGTKDKPPAAPAPPPKPPEISLDYQMKAWEIVNASSGPINGCIDKHLEFQPAAVGTVELTLDISGDGRMLKVTTKSGLAGSEKLQQCLKFIAQGWKFPTADGIAKFSTALQIKVQKGQKFTLSKPGEKSPEKKAAPSKGDSGFLGFTPSWGPGFTQ